MKILLIGSGKINKIINEIYNDLVVGIVNEENEVTTDTPDVIIDFSHPILLDKSIAMVKKYNVPIIIGTTGYDEEKTAQIKELSKIVPVLKSNNFSNGITIIKKILSDNLYFLNSYKKSILERHNITKKDCPSGTAIMLGEVIDTENITSYRESTFIAEHDIIFENEDEIITITHKSKNRKMFAVGAVNAAKWLMEKENGFYTYEDYLYE